MTLHQDFPPKVVIGRNINALALSEDQAIFFPESPSLALLDKLYDGLDKCVVLEPIFYSISEVALRSAYIGKFSFATQSIGHQVDTSQLIFHDIVKFC